MLHLTESKYYTAEQKLTILKELAFSAGFLGIFLLKNGWTG